MKTSLLGGRPLKLITSRRRQVETLSTPLRLFIASEYLETASAPPSGFSISVAESLPAPSQSVASTTVMPVTVAESMPVPSQSATAGTSMPVSVAETLPTPSQSSTLQTAINCIIVESLPAPTQTITAEAIEIFTVAVAESLPAPSQAAVAGFTPGANPRALNGPRGAWLYYPPIYAIKTKGRQEAPAPGQRGTVSASARIEPVKPLRKVERRPSFMVRGTQSALTPGQAARVRSHRAIRDRDKEEADILMLISSF